MSSQTLFSMGFHCLGLISWSGAFCTENEESLVRSGRKENEETEKVRESVEGLVNGVRKLVEEEKDDNYVK